jgi:hypothetical protein
MTIQGTIMTSIDIYTILSSKPHNPHYLKRYFKFIQILSLQSEILKDIENHHICPKAKDLFPEYTNLKTYSWNSIKLTRRQHWIAHWILAKTYGNSQTIAFYRMTKKSKYRITSKIYECFRREVNIIISKANSGPKPKISENKRNKVSCYDYYGNFLILSSEEFQKRKDVYGVAKYQNKDYMKTEEYRISVSKSKKDSIWLTHPDTGILKFVQPEDVENQLSLGFVLGYKIASYDRSLYQKTCPHCNKKFDLANFKRWHGNNCKFKL